MPSVINELLIAEIKGLVDDEGTSLLVIDPAGLKAADSLKLRTELRDVGANMKVAKASLVRKVAPDELRGHLEDKGSIGLVSGEDIGAAAKIIRDLAKDDKVSVRAGYIEGKALDDKSASRLADLPSREELHGKLVNVLAAPMANLARLLNEVPTAFVRVLNAAKDKQS